MSLQRIGDGFLKHRSGHREETKSFPVCTVSSGPRKQLRPPTKVVTDSALASNRNKSSSSSADVAHQYNISLCTATGRFDRVRLVEWLEYHMLLGIEHFYIYDTSFSEDKAETNDQHVKPHQILSDYLNEGKVTLITWPYSNCVRGMASGRPTWWVDKAQNNTEIFFGPPRAISQTAALASCYSRFRHTSQYMVHIDDDEFIALSSFGNFSTTNNTNSSHRNDNFSHQLADRSASYLFEYAKRIFDSFPQASGIRFFPVFVPDCVLAATLTSINPHLPSPLTPAKLSHWQNKEGCRTLPRLCKQHDGLPFFSYEGKMIMRTDAVRMFFVHYLTLIERGGPWKKTKQLIEPKMTDAALLHFKVPAGVSGVIWGTQLPIQRVAVAEECIYNESFVPKDYAQVSSNVLEALAVKVGRRLKR
jgi:hypothetical protein